MEYLKTDRALFPGKFIFFPNLGKNCRKWPQIGFLDFLRNVVLNFYGNNLKWKLLLLLIFHHQSHIWRNSGSRVMGRNSVVQSNCRILSNVISQGRREWCLFFPYRETWTFSRNWFYHLRCAYPDMPKVPEIRSLHIFALSLEKHEGWSGSSACRINKTDDTITLDVCNQACPKYPKYQVCNIFGIPQGKREELSWFFACR